MASKYALVLFIDSDDVDIVLTKTIITDHDRDTLNCEDWEADTEVQVLWSLSKKAREKAEKHAARVLRFSSMYRFRFLAILAREYMSVNGSH